jgi:hypothetical protein
MQKVIRNVSFPTALYQRVRKAGPTNREVLRTAISEELGEVKRLLMEAGFAAPEGARHLVRTPLDVDIDEQLRVESELLGIDATSLILACLRRHFGVRLGDRDRSQFVRYAKASRSRKKE